MNGFWETVASNAVVATLLAACAPVLGRVWKNAAMIHLLWVVVLLKLFTPPLVTTGLPFASRPPAVVAHVKAESSPSREASVRSAPVEVSTPRIADVDDVPIVTHHEIPQESVHVPWSPFAILGAIWLGGACCVALVYVVALRRFAGVVRDLEPAPNSISSMVAELSHRLGLRRAPEVFMTPQGLPPLVWSVGLCPRVILPSDLFARLSREAQATIIAHELIHIRRGDHLVRILELAATTVFWWHPIAWLAGRQLRELEEQCCDSQVLELVPDQPRTYAVALVDTLEFLSGRPRIAVPLRTAIHSTGSLSRRIQMLTRRQTNRLGALSITLVAGLVALPLAVAFDPHQKPAAEVQPPDQAAVLRGRVLSDKDVPLPGVRVRVAVPATDMRLIDLAEYRKDRLILEARTDAQGDYRLELPGVAGPTKVSIDALMPGFRRKVGTLMAGGDADEVEVAPGKPANASFKLETASYFSGIVVDEKGEPIPAVEIGAYFAFEELGEEAQGGVGGVEMTATGADGTFEIFNFTTTLKAFDEEKGKGLILFAHPDHVQSIIEDVALIEPDQRRTMRIVLPTGRKIAGTVVDEAGKPVPKAMVEAGLVGGKGSLISDGRHRKATVTDGDGKFVLRGLKDGKTKLTVNALAIKKKVILPMALDADKLGLEVRVQAINLPADMKKYTVLGMQLTDVTPQLKSTYDIFNDGGAVVLDPGQDFQRLDVGDLAEGYAFWMVGEKRVGSVREFVNQILAETGSHDLDSYTVRVVYEFKTPEFVGTNTQHMKITKDDLKQLQALAEKLAKEPK